MVSYRQSCLLRGPALRSPSRALCVHNCPIGTTTTVLGSVCLTRLHISSTQSQGCAKSFLWAKNCNWARGECGSTSVKLAQSSQWLKRETQKLATVRSWGVVQKQATAYATPPSPPTIVSESPCIMLSKPCHTIAIHHVIVIYGKRIQLFIRQNNIPHDDEHCPLSHL